MYPDRSRFPVWLVYALVCMFWWGLWGFLSKVGSGTATPLQLQILFSLGMLPVAIAMLWKMNWRLERNLRGVSYGILSGITTGLGVLAYYAALHQQDASVVTPVTGLFPLLTVVLAFVVLRERLTKVQITGVVLALVAIAILSV